jgi:hypothetical protein
MNWELEGVGQGTESPVPLEQEGVIEDRSEDGLSESFQLLQMDVEYERQEGETLPIDSETWCSVSAVGFQSWDVPESPALRVDTSNGKRLRMSFEYSEW